MVDAVEGVAEVIGQRVGCGDGVVAGLDLDGPAAAGGADEFPDRPARLRFDPAADREGGEHDGQVGFELKQLASTRKAADRAREDRNDPLTLGVSAMITVLTCGFLEWVTEIETSLSAWEVCGRCPPGTCRFRDLQGS